MKLVIEISEEMYGDIINRNPELDSEVVLDRLVSGVDNGVPLTHCNECDYWEKSENSLQGRCCLLQMYPTGEWFCANAKRHWRIQ